MTLLSIAYFLHSCIKVESECQGIRHLAEMISYLRLTICSSLLDDSTVCRKKDAYATSPWKLTLTVAGGCS